MFVAASPLAVGRVSRERVMNNRNVEDPKCEAEGAKAVVDFPFTRRDLLQASSVFGAAVLVPGCASAVSAAASRAAPSRDDKTSCEVR
jgi:hypothetical protein